MAVDEIRNRTRRKLEALVGAEEASYLMDRPPGGWSDLVTNQVLDAKLGALDARFDALEHRMLAAISDLRADFHHHTNRLILWMVPTIFAGIAALGGAASLLD